ncbi:hypothetical protein D0Z08_24790 [Nocardioides immobilis]|uniref:Uncharacterized protein n=1 Tax=Nocardioides immobilis TaxID=2049295 RepID=A0A417XVG5_9ACTN|nr:DUF6167 family protein [Nocardioides immobilis]RHW24336.1 hypothetical protein D0Z08_24790 [Nocardioides immobilis]
MRRGFWFVAGAATGVYGVVKARRVAEAFTADGVRDRASAASVGARMFREEFREARTDAEAALRESYEVAAARHRELTSGARPAIEGSETERGQD